MFTTIPILRDAAAAGHEMYALVVSLFPLCRSITGDGVRETLRRVGEGIPLELHEVPSGTPVFDWSVPKEWNIREAWIKDPAGRKIADFQESNLHVVGYSPPVRRRMPLPELQAHLHSLPEHPDWIPYRTSYYQETWGFCLPHRTRESLVDGEYEVCIEAKLADGSLTYGECVLPGQQPDEVLISCHVCHPSLANDNLSGIAVAAFLARHLQNIPRRYTYRFLFIPGTIGPITWLALNESAAARIRHGLVLACLGDAGDPTYKKSRQGNAVVDRAVLHVLRHRGGSFRAVEFSPYGYDERQYNSPGFNLPVGCLMRSMYGTFPEYHTSADNLEFVRPESLSDSLGLLLAAVEILENNRAFLNRNPKCEPQLGRRGLYDQLGGRNEAVAAQTELLWVLNLSDGQHTLLDIAERAAQPFAAVVKAAELLQRNGLLEEIRPEA